MIVSLFRTSVGRRRGRCAARTLLASLVFGSAAWMPLGIATAVDDQESWPLVYETDFEGTADDWRPTEDETWEIRQEAGRGGTYHQFRKEPSYQPEHRSPHHIAWLDGIEVTSFRLDAKVRSTHPDYGHRDVCLFFGRQDASHFYYVHLAKQGDDHANQIFLVNGAPRTKISLSTTAGTDWDDAWHDVRIVRDAESGRIEVFFDDMTKPVMTAEDKSFTWGAIGLGSFDDTSAWDDIRLYGLKRTPAP